MFVTGIAVFVEVGRGGNVTRFELAQELCKMLTVQTINRLKDCVRRIVQIYHCLDDQVSLQGGDYDFVPSC